ncbi:MAG: hypothetical protein ACRD5I_00070 [Candidatus Acidiferrales bacterium]
MDADWAKTYAAKDDGELVALAAESDELVDEARKALWSELKHRGLEDEASAAYNNRPAQPLLSLRPTDSITTVGVFTTLAEATLARTRLESAGIPCFLAEEHVVRMDWFLAQAVGWIKLQVNEADLGPAIELVGEPAAVEGEAEASDLDTARVLPSWYNIRTVAWFSLLYTMVVWILVALVELIGFIWRAL